MTQLNLTLAVRDADLTEQFYRDILELSIETVQHGDFLTVHFRNVSVVFQPIEQMEQQHPALLQHLERSQLGAGLQLELSCDRIEELESRLNHCGWPIVYELEDQEHQRRELWIQDPDGYLLVLNGESAP